MAEKDVQDGTYLGNRNVYRIPLLVNGKDTGMSRSQQEDYLADLDNIDKMFKDSFNNRNKPITGGGADHSIEDAPYLQSNANRERNKTIARNVAETADAGMNIADAISMGGLVGLGGKLALEGAKVAGRKVGKKIPTMGSKRGFFNAEWQKAHPEYNAEALQYALTNNIAGKDAATALMRGNDKVRDELTTTLQRTKETGIPIKHSDGSRALGYVTHRFSYDPVSQSYVAKPVAVNLGTGGQTALHEAGHLYHNLAGRQDGVVGVGKNGEKFIGSNIQGEYADELDDLFKNSKFNEIVENEFRPMKKKDLDLTHLVSRYKDIAPQNGVDRVSYDMADWAAQIPEDKGGVFQTKSGMMNGYQPYIGVHQKDYVKSHREVGEPRIGTEEGTNNVVADALSSREGYTNLVNNGINPDEVANVKFRTHLTYTPEEEMKLAEELSKSPDYINYKRMDNPKIRATGSHANKFFAKEAKYMEENGGDHSPDWYEAVHDKWFGDRYGRLDEDDMENLFASWRKNNNVSNNDDKVAESWKSLDNNMRNQIIDIAGKGKLDRFEFPEAIRKYLVGQDYSTVKKFLNASEDVQDRMFRDWQWSL